jgi:hypothetical protein
MNGSPANLFELTQIAGRKNRTCHSEAPQINYFHNNEKTSWTNIKFNLGK